MAARSPSRKLLTKLLLATLGPTVVALGGFGFLAHETARRTLEDELGKRVAGAATGAALLVLPEQIRAIGTGDEASLTYGRITRGLELARVRFGVRRVALVARDLSGRGDTEGRIALGARAHEFSADAVELERAARGVASSSPLFLGDDGRPYKRGYAGVAVGPDVAGFVMVEASADYLVALAAFRRWIVAAGALGLLLVIAASVLVARHLTRP